jgi:hypothetical protein
MKDPRPGAESAHLPAFHRRGSLPIHGHCIHNDLPPRTHNFTMKGMFAAVMWIALWSLVITTVVSADLKKRHQMVTQRMGR